MKGGSGRHAARVAAGILVTRVLGFVRERVFALHDDESLVLDERHLRAPSPDEGWGERGDRPHARWAGLVLLGVGRVGADRGHQRQGQPDGPREGRSDAGGTSAPLGNSVRILGHDGSLLGRAGRRARSGRVRRRRRLLRRR